MTYRQASLTPTQARAVLIYNTADGGTCSEISKRYETTRLGTWRWCLA